MCCERFGYAYRCYRHECSKLLVNRNYKERHGNGYKVVLLCFFFFFSSRRRHTRSYGDWSSDVCSSDLRPAAAIHHQSRRGRADHRERRRDATDRRRRGDPRRGHVGEGASFQGARRQAADRKSTRLNSSHRTTSYAVFCLKKKTWSALRRSTSSIPCGSNVSVLSRG